MTVVCPRCGEENPDRARFCMVCAEPLTETVARPAREERKIVSVLFVDLVGFTAASESVDPEDVRARLHAYHARAKGEVERFGGTIEKFVGDAVMTVFGAPVAHEDDAERAVRAGLAILEAVEALELEARAAVNTGEAVVALDARPELGQGIVTGDVVNTAARLQGTAPPGGLVAGEQTYWATRHANYECGTGAPVHRPDSQYQLKFGAQKGVQARSRGQFAPLQECSAPSFSLQNQHFQAGIPRVAKEAVA